MNLRVLKVKIVKNDDYILQDNKWVKKVRVDNANQ